MKRAIRSFAIVARRSRRIALAVAACCASLSGYAIAQQSAPRVALPARALDVLDYDLTLDLPDSGRRIEGRAVLQVARNGHADSLALDLVGLRVDSVLVDGVASAYRRDSLTIRVPLPDAAANGRTVVTVRYGGEVIDGLIVGTDSSGRWQAFADNWPTRARYWIPSVDDPADKATVSWTVRAPADRTVIANGALVSRAPASDSSGRRPRIETRWREARPIPVYLMVIAAAPLVSLDLAPAACGRAEFARCVAQTVYVAPEQRDFLPGPFADAPAILDFFSLRIAPFPYEKLAHLQSATRFGGMENASAIFYASAPFVRRTMTSGVIAHETAHQWFGDAVTEQSWAHLWLSEGFATYFAALWVEHARGDSAFRSEMRAMRAKILADSAVTWRRPVLDSAETNYLQLLNVNSYEKGAWTLHMLRSLLGDSAFFDGVRGYYMHHRHSTAVTDDLRRELERASGADLRWFFDQWLRRPGVIDVTASVRVDRERRELVVDLAQGARTAPYRFPLTLDVTDAAGRRQRVALDVPASAHSVLRVPTTLRGRALRVVLDPDVRLLATFSQR